MTKAADEAAARHPVATHPNGLPAYLLLDVDGVADVATLNLSTDGPLLPTLASHARAARANALVFLVVYMGHGRHREALDVSGLVWASINHLRLTQPDFKAVYDAIRAHMEGRRVIEAEEEFHRRAVDGWEEPVFNREGEVGSVRKFSDRLLELELKAGRPEKFGDKVKHEHEGEIGIRYEFIGLTRDPARLAKPVLDVETDTTTVPQPEE